MIVKMKMVKLTSKIRKAWQGSSSGFTLIEVLIALALIGIIAIAFLSALSTASMALITADERATAESLARSQMEYVKNQPYDNINDPPQYTKLPDPEIPNGYDIVITPERLDPEGDGTDDDDGIQKITVTVSRDGEEVITLEDYIRLP
jgi:prepilin-type N-terminal cleavage/methylation domain-containing protein